MDDIDIIIAAVKRLDAEATPGPWGYDMADAVTHDGVKMPAADMRGANGEWLGFVDHSADDAEQPPVENDAALIAYYRTAAPALAREVQRLTAERDGMADLLRDLSCDGCEYGDNCPPNAGTRHGQCIPCKCREELERLATQKEPTT